MFKYCLTLVLLLGIAGAAPAEPEFRKTPAGLQALVKANADVVHAEKLENEQTGKPEWVVTTEETAPQAVKLAAPALSFYLNSVDDAGNPLAWINANGMVVVNTAMDPYVFDEGFNGARDLRKEVVRGRDANVGFSQKLDPLPDQVAGLDHKLFVGFAILTVAIVGLAGGCMYELGYIKRGKASGKFEKRREEESAQRLTNKINGLVKANMDNVQKVVDGKADKTKVTELEHKLNALLGMSSKPGTNGTGHKPEPAPDPKSIPKWNDATQPPAPHTNGATIKELLPPLPVPNTEEEPGNIDTEQLSAPVQSILDQMQAKQPTEVPDEGEPTVVKKNGGAQKILL